MTGWPKRFLARNLPEVFCKCLQRSFTSQRGDDRRIVRYYMGDGHPTFNREPLYWLLTLWPLLLGWWPSLPSSGFHPSFLPQGNGILLRYWSHLSHSWSNVFPRGVFGTEGYSKTRDSLRVVGWECPKKLAKHSKILKMWIMKWPVGTVFYVQRVSGEICQTETERERERMYFWKRGQHAYTNSPGKKNIEPKHDTPGYTPIN